MNTAPPALELWQPQDMARRIDDVMAVFEHAYAPSPEHRIRARERFVADTKLPGYRAVATVTEQGELAAFAYGFHMHPGHWWHRSVHNVLDDHDRRRWLSDSFEIAELHVHPSFQRIGIGSRQLRALLAVSHGNTALLSTTEADETQSPALRLYHRMGFVDVTRNLYFYGAPKLYAVLGLDLTKPITERRNGTAARISPPSPRAVVTPTGYHRPDVPHLRPTPPPAVTAGGHSRPE